jgi:hypothetical protein
MILIYTIYLLLSSLVVFLVYYSSLSKFIKASALTATVLLGLVTQDHYTAQLGKPVEAYPSGEFVYVHHVSAGDDIVLWVWTEDSGDRLYVFPYSQETAKKLEEAKEGTKEGKPQVGEFKEKKGDQFAPGLRLDDWRGPSTQETK